MKSFSPHFFDTNEDENPEEDRSTSNTPEVYQEQPNTDGAHISQSNVKGASNTESGLWGYHAVSKNKPRVMMDPCLINSRKG